MLRSLVGSEMCIRDSDTSEEQLEVLTPLHGDVIKVFLQVVPLRITSRLVPGHDGLPCSLYGTCCMHPLFDREPLYGFHKELPGLLALFHLFLPIPVDQLIVVRHTPRTSCDQNGVACGINRTDQTPSSQESLESTRPQVQLLPMDELRNSHAVLRHE